MFKNVRRRGMGILVVLAMVAGPGLVREAMALDAVVLVSSQGEGDRIIQFEFEEGLAGSKPRSADFAGPGANGTFFIRDFALRDGFLYVTSAGDNTATNGKILRYKLDGTFEDTLITAGLGGLGFPSSVALAPDGHIYVSDFSDQTRRYNSNGTFDALTAIGRARDMTFHSNGRLYKVVGNTGQITFYDAGGNFLGSSVDIAGAAFSALTEGPDGLLYLVSDANAGTGIVRYDPATNTFVDGGAPWVNPGTLNSDIAAGPDGDIYYMQVAASAVVGGIDRLSGAFLSGNYGTPFISNGNGDSALMITPEPATLGLLSVALFCMRRRRLIA